MKFFKREKKYSLPLTKLDEYAAKIFHFTAEHQRLPTNQEMFLQLEIPSASLEEVIHYFNHPAAAPDLKKYTAEELKQFDAQSIFLLPFIQGEQLNLTEVVIQLNYTTSNARHLVNFCNRVIELAAKNVAKYCELFNTAEIELNAVRVVQTHHQLQKRGAGASPVSLVTLARESRLGILSTRVAMSYYESQKSQIPKTTDLSERRVKELDQEIRKFFPDLLQLPNVSLTDILTHRNWQLPIPAPPELTVENVTQLTDKYVREYKPRTDDPILGIFQLAGDALKNIVNTFITPTIESVLSIQLPHPTLFHAQEMLSVLQPIRDQEMELAPTYNVGLQTIEYVPAEQVVILKEKERFFCSLCQKFFPKKETHQACKSCQRTICHTCHEESIRAGLTKCPVCKGTLRSVSIT